MTTLEQVRDIVGTVLQLGERTAGMRADTALLGAIPEFDSMTVVAVLTALEEHYGFTVADDEVDAAVFESLGTLARFVQAKVDG
jgi:acyl carrier protein